MDPFVTARLPPAPTRGPRSRPLIGITSSEMRRQEQIARKRHSEPAQTEIALGLTYPQAILAAGGLPMILAPAPDSVLACLVGCLDGLVISGGPDLHPSAYGQLPHGQLGPSEAEVDSFELRLCATARSLALPLLGICRGLQVINVAAGGTLHQHLPDIVGNEVSHRQPGPGRHASHAVEIDARSRIAAMVGSRRLQVNSFHHQGVDVLGDGLRVCARSADGVIEAIEGGEHEWLFGVQWHAESMTGRPRHLALFEGLVVAARANREGASLGQLAS